MTVVFLLIVILFLGVRLNASKHREKQLTDALAYEKKRAFVLYYVARTQMPEEVLHASATRAMSTIYSAEFFPPTDK